MERMYNMEGVSSRLIISLSIEQSSGHRARGCSMYEMGSASTSMTKLYEWGYYFRAATGELRAIIQDLQLVDIGDAADYLGEEATVAKELPSSAQRPLTETQTTEHLVGCDCVACQVRCSR